MRRILLSLMAVVASLARCAISQSLPYNPTTVLLSAKDPSIAYIFLQSTSPSQSQLVSLNISSTVRGSSLALKTITSDLPFLQAASSGKAQAFLPSISSSGSIGVYAGSCAERSSFWIFYPSYDQSGHALDHGNWREMSATTQSSITPASLPYANFLASSFSFSPSVPSNDSQRVVYTFGGMCPTTASNSSTWQSAASYSNNMLKLSYTSSTSYELSLSSSLNNRPIAEAGFSVTALTPAFSNSSTGIVTQAQSFMLLGGHTNQAFINMSQVALFSLPQERWSFQGIQSTQENGATELAIKSTFSTNSKTPDPRSGHSAVLSPDGTSIIIFGGWVGDTSTPAEPQLAILRTGSGFGGTDEWRWELPMSTGAGLPTGEGLYGHGAAMLPGNVMMVVGGYHITAVGSGKPARRTDGSTMAYFLNTTSMTWLSDYTNPRLNSSTIISPGGSSISDSLTMAKKVGLGAGLGIGLFALLSAVIFYFWYSRRANKQRRNAREKDLQELSRSAASFYANRGAQVSHSREENRWGAYGNSEMAQREGLIPLPGPGQETNLGNRLMNSGSRGNGGHAISSYAPYNAYGDYDENMGRSMAHRASNNRAGVSIPRKPINPRNARGYYQPTPISGPNQSYDLGGSHSRANSLGTAGAIHPIYEADEEMEMSAHGADADIVEGSGVRHSLTAVDSNPFRDSNAQALPPLSLSSQGSRPGTGYDPYRDRATPTPESSAQDREREINEWVADWAAADAIMHSRAKSMNQSGRLSPSKESTSGRTESNISERSMASVNALGLGRNGSMRNNSLSGFFSSGAMSWNPFAHQVTISNGLGSIVESNNGDVSPVSELSSQNGRNLRPPPSSGSGTSSFTTAQTSQSLSTLRTEGESLLSRPRDTAPQRSGSPTKAKATAFSRRQKAGWLGSLKRVLIRQEDDIGSYSNSSARSSPTRGHRSPSLSSSPTKAYHDLSVGSAGSASSVAQPPRRAVSATATMWRRKQGKYDWEDSEEKRSNTLTLENSTWGATSSAGGAERRRDEDDDEWDIERAVANRVVQVMFTMPKERLRVVNTDVESTDAEGSESAESNDMEQPTNTSLLEKHDEKGKARETLPEPEKPMTGKGPLVDLGEDSERETTSRPGSPGKGKGKVQKIVEKMERWNG